MPRFVVCAACGHQREIAPRVETIHGRCRECSSLRVFIRPRPAAWKPTPYDTKLLRVLRIEAD